MHEDLSAVRVMFRSDSPVNAAFEYLIAHAKAAGFMLIPRKPSTVVRSVELQWPHIKRNPFSIQGQSDHLNFVLRGPILKAHPSLAQDIKERFESAVLTRSGECTKRLATVDDVQEMLSFLREQGVWPSSRSHRRFTADTFESVTATHLLGAARRLVAGLEDHPFGPSTDYDLEFEGHRLPPKAVFGLAASEALGFLVLPENFSGGEGMVCFRMLREAGFEIAPKEKEPTTESLLNDDDRTWAEGRLELVTHLKRERAPGLSKKKRDQFRQTHRRLYCEACKMDPVEVFGSIHGEACMEVHHRDRPVAEMGDGHDTKLEELELLCANCHRVRHRLLKASLSQ